MEKKNVLPMNKVLVEADTLLVDMQKIIKQNRKTPNVKTGVQLIWSWYGFISRCIFLSPEMEKQFKLIEQFLLAKENPVWDLYKHHQGLDKLESNLFILSFLIKLKVEARNYLHGELLKAIDETKDISGIVKQQAILEKIKNLR